MKASSKGKDKPERQRRGNSPCEFIVKLVEMMKKFPNNIRWSEDGEFVEFVDMALIQNEVIPTFFRHRNMLSFIRQLNMYYFSKVEREDDNMMKFKHSVFRKGNDDNFHLISRRNKTRDDIISNIEKNYGETLVLLERQDRLSIEAKALIKMGIQYITICLKNLRKMKISVEELTQQLKSVRSKELKNVLARLKDESQVEAVKLIDSYKYLDTFVKESLCRDMNTKAQEIPPSLVSYIGFLDQPRTIKDVDMNKIISLRSECSIIMNFPSDDCSLGRHLQEHDEEISLEEDLKDDGNLHANSLLQLQLHSNDNNGEDHQL